MKAEIRRRGHRSWSLVLACLVVGGCGSSVTEVGDPPAAPTENDPAYRIERVRPWLLVGNALTQGHDQLEIEVYAPEGTDTVDAWLGDVPGVRLARGDDGGFRQIIDVSELPAGTYPLLLAADGSDTAFAQLDIHRSHPLYILVSTDWDDADNGDYSLQLQEELHQYHPELRLTHFVGPYTYTDSTITEERRQFLTDWLLGMRDDYDDEIGLHIHPYCNFVETTDVACRTEPSFVYDEGDETGYTVRCNAYSEEEFTELLLASDMLFEEHGLGKPTSFRAGGWSADITTLKALGNAGYVADTSANNWARMEEWQDVQNGQLYEWNMANWTTIDDTSQPYYPSESDVLAHASPYVPVLEVPDNGILVDYVTAEEMIEIFDANWDRTPLSAPRAYSIGYHPPNFNDQYQRRIRGALTHVDQFLASQGNGPAVYGTLSEMPLVWPAP